MRYLVSFRSGFLNPANVRMLEWQESLEPNLKWSERLSNNRATRVRFLPSCIQNAHVKSDYNPAYVRINGSRIRVIVCKTSKKVPVPENLSDLSKSGLNGVRLIETNLYSRIRVPNEGWHCVHWVRASDFVFKIKFHVFWILLLEKLVFVILKIINFRGELIDVLAVKRRHWYGPSAWPLQCFFFQN